MRPRLTLLLTTLLLLCYAWFYNGSGGNPVARLNMTRAIVEKGQLASNGVGFTTDDELNLGGRWISSKAPGVSMLGVPPYTVSYALRDALDLDTPRARNVAVHFTTVVAVGVPCALLAVALLGMLTGIGASEAAAALAVVAIGLGTTYWPYATLYMGHSLAGVLAVGSFAILFHVGRRREQEGGAPKKVFAAALLVGAAVLVEYPVAIAAAGLTAYLLATRPTARAEAAWAVGGALAVGLLLVYNQVAFGSPLALSYLNYSKVADSPFPVHSQGVGGVGWPSGAILRKLLIGETRGLLYFSPLTLVALAALPILAVRRRDLRRELALVAFLAAAFLAFNAGYGDSIRYWGGANSAGPRHLVPMFPFLALPLALVFTSWPVLSLVAVLGSVGLMLAITAVLPQIHQLYGAPLPELIFPYFLDGRLSVARGGMVGPRLVTEDSIAYGLGKLVGLPGSWSLAPLLLGMAILAGLLLRELARRGALTARGAALGGALTGAALLALLAGPLAYQRAHAAPAAGPGAWMAVYDPGDCGGPLIWQGRVEGLAARWGRAGEVRPWPGEMCARLAAVWTVDAAEDVSLQIRGRTPRLWIDGRQVALERALGGTLPTWLAEVHLDPGPHRVQLTLDVESIRGDPGLRRAVAGKDGFHPIPPRALEVTDELRAARWP